MPSSPSPAGLLVVGTTSAAGKSLFVAGLLRWLSRAGWPVRPFKAVNLSLNSVPAVDGGEIAVAQWVQCRAAGVAPASRYNPVLLKSAGAHEVEVIVRGRPRHRIRDWRREMPALAPRLWEAIAAALAEVEDDGAFLVAEGAGSPAEVNLRRTDLANFRVARALDLPALLVADLERGGAIAQVVGTLRLLRPSERARVKGIVLNRMRGDPGLLGPARRYVRRATGVPVIGVLPYIEPTWASLPDEDALDLDRSRRARPIRPARRGSARGRPVEVGLVRLPHAANTGDFAGLVPEAGLVARWMERPSEIARLAAVLLPGSRRTRDDLAWMERTGWTRAILAAHANGMRIAGLCGGYQMLGETLDDPHGFEGPRGRSRGLGLLPIRTRFAPEKVVRPVRARSRAGHPWIARGVVLEGYELHRGRVERRNGEPALFEIEPALSARGGAATRAEPEGARSRDGRVWGTLLHGVLANPVAARGLAAWARGRRPPRARSVAPPVPLYPELDRSLDRIADVVAAHLDRSALSRLLGRPMPPVPRPRRGDSGR